MLKIWSADQSKAAEAQQMALALAAVNSAAALGKYDPSSKHPSTLSADSLREGFRGWTAH
mgnify:CR=1 FL=1